MRTVAILGAGGFVGARLVEMFHLEQFVTVRPVVRRFSSLARLSRFELDARVANATDFADAFEGCEVVVCAIVGDEKEIEAIVQPLWRACETAGVRRLIYLSSGSVHGQAPEHGTTETAPLSDKQSNWYNNAKVRAERKLRELQKSSKLELVVLRPTIVYGPRSRWIWEVAESLRNGTAGLVNGGNGICNCIYVDNLAHAIKLGIDATVNGETFLISDEETVTWKQFYEAIAARLRVSTIPTVAAGAAERERFDLVKTVRGIPGMQQVVLPVIPGQLKRAVKGAWHGLIKDEDENGWKLPKKAAPKLSAEMNALQQCSWRLPHVKAARLLNYRAPVSFAEGMRRSLAWLEFARFPGLQND